MTFFVKQEEEIFERFDELHKERTYPLDMYQKMLTEVGFKVEVFADFMDEHPNEKANVGSLFVISNREKSRFFVNFSL